jgi:multidrug resistance efflux pump
LARLESGARPEEIAAAEAAVRAAEAELARLKAGPKPEEIAAAKARVDQAASVVRQAQAAYDKIAWQPGAGASPQAVALEQATANYEAAKAAYEALLRGATAEELAAAQARVDQARARLALLQAGATPQELAVAQARVDQVRAQLARLQAGATPEELAAARARVEAAQAALEQARARLDQVTLRAPFAGTVARLDVRVGEVVMPGQPVLILGDLSTLQVETDDLSEEDVAWVQIGAPVTITLDALPERTFQGRVIAIAPMASVDQGGTNYKVTVALEEQDPAMRWGMTAYVEVEVNP